MSREIEDIDDSLQPELQPAAPFGEPRTLGPAAAREPAAPESLASQPEAPTAQPGGPGAASTPRPGAVRCSQCAADVVPTTPNHCPICGGWVFDNTGALTHGLRSKKLAAKVDAYRIDLLDQLYAERGGKSALDVVSRIAIENFALVCAQHKTIEARLDQDGLFTQTGRRRNAFDMLKGISETIDRLRAELPPPIKRTRLSSEDYSAMSEDELIERLEAMLKDCYERRDLMGDLPRRPGLGT